MRSIKKLRFIFTIFLLITLCTSCKAVSNTGTNTEEPSTDYDSIDFSTLKEKIHVQFKSDMDMEVLDGYVERKISDENYSVDIVFWTEIDLYEVELVGVNYDTLEFVADKSYVIEREIPINSGIIFTHSLSSGSIPNTAIVIRNKAGEEKSFLIHESGQDGSLLLTEEQVIYQVNED